MPAPARISVPVKQPTPVKSTTNSAPKTPASIPRPKARVAHRRRARGRMDETDTDDDLEREPRSDSDSDSGASTPESEALSDSDEEEFKPESRVLSPSRPPFITAASTSSARPSPSPSPTNAPGFPQSHDWSDMVAEENANGVAELPVIDFADFSSHVEVVSPPSHSTPSPPQSAPNQLETSQDAAATSTVSTATRKPGQSARQAYLTRLDSDPAYVPTLGQFWSHDDRLLDKDLRSLSGWWRGRWQGRGRGARGRGGFAGGWGMRGMRGRGSFRNDNSSPRPEDVLQEEAPPVDCAWTHDGFEELKKAEEAKRQQFSFRGRGTLPRGRNGYRGGYSARGGFTSANRSSSPHHSQVRAQSESQQSSSLDILKFGDGTRPWFTMKPERVWTKQFDGYLYFETHLKPMHSQGLGQGVRVKLPGQRCAKGKLGELANEAVVVRLPQRNIAAPRSVSSTATDPLSDRTVVVKLPASTSPGKEKELSVPEDVNTVAPPPMEAQPPLRSAPTTLSRTYPTQEASTFASAHPTVPPPKHASDVVISTPQTPAGHPTAISQPQRAASEDSSIIARAGSSQSYRQPDPPGTRESETVPPHPPALPTMQKGVSSFQPSPSYGSPYSYPTPGLPLPPGIAVSETGVTYEIATGRAVYLHTPPPPPPPPPMQVPMYNPRPMPMHHTHHGGVHFLPHHGHGHTSSMSMSVSPPAFLSSPPIFALPRQSSRIEIRAPGEEKGKERETVPDGSNNQGRRAGSRLAVNINAEPFTPAAHAQTQGISYYATEPQQQAFDEVQRHHQHQQSIYQPASYYYPVPADGSAPYGYGQQYANVDAAQTQPYDTYGQEPYPQPHAVYY